MMNLFKKNSGTDDENVVFICCKILSTFAVKHTLSTVRKEVSSHVESTSLLAIKDTLQVYGIESVAIRKDKYSYVDFETPFVCAIQQEDWGQPAFTVVSACEQEQITYLDPVLHSLQTIALSDFEQMDKEIVLLIDCETRKDEVNYKENRQSERSANVIRQMPVFAFGLIVLVTLGIMVSSLVSTSWIAPVFLLSSAAGLLVSALLVWHEVDSHNPFIREVCGGQGRKMNCDAVLSSSGAKFLDVSWAVWGFAYFSTFFLSTVLFVQQPVYTELWQVISILALLYLPYSLYYQSRMVKQWCPLCLTVLAILLVNATLSMIMLRSQQAIFFDGQAVFHTLAMGLILLLLVYYAIPALKEARESKSYAKRWKRLRYNPDIFEALLRKSNQVSVSAEGLGIVVGNPNAKNEIIKVCNPYCGPCSKAHPELEQLIKQNPDVKVRVIFTASGEPDDIKTAPVTHLLAIQSKDNPGQTHQALDDWYLAERKDYEMFATKYPMNGELKEQKDKIIAMRAWCDVMKIRATPTIYINGAELPDSYHIAELKNFF